MRFNKINELKAILDAVIPTKIPPGSSKASGHFHVVGPL